MYFTQVIVSLLMACVITTCVWCRTHVYSTNDSLKIIEERLRRSLNVDNDETTVPFNPKNMERMLEKAILKIIMGNLSTGDMLLLKSLNYTLEEVLAIRERELAKKINNNSQNHNKIKPKLKLSRNNNNGNGKKIKKSKIKKSDDKIIDIDAYNRQAVYDYENLANKMEEDTKLSHIDYEDPYENNKNEKIINENNNNNNNEENIHLNFDRAMKPHIIFKIRYEDLDLNSNITELSNKYLDTTTIASSTMDIDLSLSSLISASTTIADNNKNTFQYTTDTTTSLPISYNSTTTQSSLKNNEIIKINTSELLLSNDTEQLTNTEVSLINNINNETEIMEIEKSKKLNNKRVSEYEGLEWIEDDVYRVIPEALNDEMISEINNNSNQQLSTTDEIMTNDDDNYNNSSNNSSNINNSDNRNEYQEDLPQSQLEQSRNENSVGNITSYQQLTLAHRRDENQSNVDSQGQKAIEDIKLRVLAMTGRFNLTSSSNQIQRERLTMFSPTCQIPKNTDLDVWTDPFAMNMHFQLNLTSTDHVVAAKLRIYKLPQNNLTILSTMNINGTFEDDEEEEKKIRISIFFYTKSLKKHRAKKRLMDSVVTSLTPDGSHLALDVRQALRFWRQTPRSHGSNTNNHGLIIQVEDQDGRPLKPASYIQQDACHTNEDNADDKAYQRVPALFLQACSRYVRVVKGETVTYVNCKHLKRNRYRRDNAASFT